MKSLRLVLLIPLLLAASCTQLIRQPYDRAAEYRRDIKLSITAYRNPDKELWRLEARGVAVVPPADWYRIEGETKGDIDFLVWQTCGGQTSLERQGDSFSIEEFRPVAIGPACRNNILEIRGIEEKKRRNSGAVVVVADPGRYQLKASLVCNNVASQAVGSYACQSMAGLVQKIGFETPVFVVQESSPGCSIGTFADQAEFVFKMPPRRCNYEFVEVAAPHRRGWLTLYPYSDIVITREGD